MEEKKTILLKLKKSHRIDEWIVYNPDSFQTCHTHCRHKRVALKIRYLVTHKIVPTTHDPCFVTSCIRITKDKQYKQQLENYLKQLKGE